MMTSSALTLPGSRLVNEDAVAVFTKDNYCLAVLCDGLGGHGKGEVASSLVTDCFGEEFDDFCKSKQKSKEFLPKAFLYAQAKLLELQKTEKLIREMKTTCVAILMDKKRAHIAHIGDSRLYVFRGGRVTFRTLDHSVPQMLVFSNEIKESEIRHHPDRSLLLRVMGTPWETPQFEVSKPASLHKLDAFLLCSDGFWELIEESEMEQLLRESSTAEEWIQRMQRVVEANGTGLNMDNYSAIALIRG